ncbi:MAG: phosphatase PAP2 family protein [Paludibacter sp.]|nr:phosphatase PAP2 family protein [Paludibacter sp.]
MSDSASVSSAVNHNWLHSRYVHESIVPVSLALGSATIIAIPGLKQYLQTRLMWNNDQLPGYINLGDDYIRYAPAVAAYALSAFGMKSQHRFIDRSVILAVSYIASDFVVYNVKKLAKSPRPSGRTTSSDGYSLPSQHAAMSFVAATFLDHELGYISPWISVGGYLTASYVAYARVARNAHWTSDVLMGAAVGIITTNAAYWAYDGVMKLFPKKLTITPIISPQQAGLYVSYNFN